MAFSRTFVRPLRRIFHYGNEAEKGMRIQLARLSVLYGDLMLEYVGAQSEELEDLDVQGVGARRHYFVRKTVGTIAEVEQAINVLNANTAFKNRKLQMAEARVANIDKVVAFFSKDHQFLKDWRNRIGGHFSDAAAEHAVDELPPDMPAVIEVFRTDNGGADVRLKFGHDVMLYGLTSTKDPTKDRYTFHEESMSWLANAVGHVIIYVHEVSHEFILE